MSEPGPASFRPAAIVAVLNRHQVRYVVIGAFAAIALTCATAPRFC